MKLTNQQLNHFETEGYLVVEDVIDPITVLDPLVKEYEGVLNNFANELFGKGEIKDLYQDLDFSERLTQIYIDSGKVHNQYFDFSLPQTGIKYDTPMWHGPAVFNVLTCPQLLDVVESVIGSEIYCNPVQHVRFKPPEQYAPLNEDGSVQFGATKWHQDNGVVNEDADETDMLTVWVPVWDASEEDGCLHLVPKSHKDGLNIHCPIEGTVAMPDDVFKKQDAISIPMKRGSVLLMHRLTCHGSLPNLSERIRWSLDLRYNPIGQSSGRLAFPGFNAKSSINPDTVLKNPVIWDSMWKDARKKLAAQEDPDYNRWSSDHPACA